MSHSALRLYFILAATLSLSPLFMTLSLDLEEGHEEQADEAQCCGKPKERSVWLEWIMRVVASRRRVRGNTRENCGEDGETDCDCKFDGGLEN